MDNLRLPNFYCIGTQKAGTTTLHKILKQHPDIYLPDIKEAHFFHKDHLYNRGLKWYLNEFFFNVGNEKIIGSITPEYLYFENSAERIYQTIGKDVKFIVVLRNPAERAYSHYKMTRYRGIEPLSFEEAIIKENDRLKENFYNKIHYSYLTRGYYYHQISRYLQFFPLENFLFLNFEKEIRENLNQTVIKVCNFFEIENHSLNTKIEANTAKEAIIPSLNKILRDKPNYIENIVRFIPKIFKIGYRSLMLKLNSKPPTNHQLDRSLKEYLCSHYFLNDLQKLEENLDISVD